jgi:hypothetical protein
MASDVTVQSVPEETWAEDGVTEREDGDSAHAHE